MSTVQTVTYTATATSTGGSCVSAPQQIIVKVNPKPVMTSTDTATLCSGAALSIPFTNSVTSTYVWVASDNSNTTGETITSQTTNTISNTLNNSTLAAQTVVYNVTPTSTGGACVGNVQTIKVSVNPNPNMTSISSILICGDGTPPNIALTADIASTYSWKTTNNPNTTGESTSANTNDTINDAIVNHTLNMQTLTYTVTPTSTGGSCVGTAQEVTVTVAQPIASFSNTPDMGTPPLAVSFTNSSENSNTYVWLFDDGFTDSVANTSHTYVTPNIYTVKLIATNNHLCPDTATATLTIYKLVVSNVFTPNGDGNNDFFAINKVGISSMDIEIFNRWGIKVFEAHTPDSKWDGYNTNGKTADDGTYYYIVKASGIDGQQYTEKGFLTLIR